MVIAWVSVALALAPSENTDFKRGTELFAQYKYAEARAAMAKARAAPGLDRATLLKILEVQGVSAAQQRQVAAAQAAFHELLVLDPTHTLEAEYAPRVMTPFFEERQAVLEGGALEVNPGPVENGADKVVSVSVVVAKDPMKMARAVRFHLLVGADWKVTEAPLANGRASLAIDAGEAKWWAELLGENQAQLQVIGAETAPRVDRPPAPLVVAPPPAPPPEVVAAPKSSGGAPVRAVSYGVMGAALVAGGVGAYFGVQAGNSFSQIDSAAKDGSGHIVGLNERQAYGLNATGKQNAVIADALFASAGALAVGGALMWIFGGPSEQHAVAISAAPNGVFVSGSLP